jgi:hypothetical protein
VQLGPLSLSSRDVAVAALVAGVVFLAGIAFVRHLCATLPTDYFLRPARERPPLVRLVRQVAGGALVVLGVAMLVLPGPGIVTIALGVALFDHPKKREILVRLLRREGVRRTLDDLRRRAGKDPFALD